MGSDGTRVDAAARGRHATVQRFSRDSEDPLASARTVFSLNAPATMRLTSLRSLRFAQAILLYIYSVLIALARGVTWLNPLPDLTGLGQAVFDLQVVPCAVIGSIALVDALLPHRPRLMRWAADLGSVVAVCVILLFAFALALINGVSRCLGHDSYDPGRAGGAARNCLTPTVSSQTSGARPEICGTRSRTRISDGLCPLQTPSPLHLAAGGGCRGSAR